MKEFHKQLQGALIPAHRVKRGAPYSVTTKIISDLAELEEQAKTNQARAFLDRARARYGMFNLSRLRREVEEKLIAFSQVRA